MHFVPQFDRALLTKRQAVSFVRKFLLRSTFLKPSVVIPVVAGAFAGLASFLIGGSVLLTSAAVIGIGGGLIWMIAQTARNIEGLTAEALVEQQRDMREAENRELDKLARKLRTDRDYRTKEALNLLRSLRDDFEKRAAKSESKLLSARFTDSIGQIFQSAVHQLSQTYHLFERAESLVGADRTKIMAEREAIVVKVQETTNRLQSVIRQFEGLRPDSEEVKLNELQQQLDANLEIARRTEEQMRELEQSPSQRYESYIKE